MTPLPSATKSCAATAEQGTWRGKAEENLMEPLLVVADDPPVHSLVMVAMSATLAGVQVQQTTV